MADRRRGARPGADDGGPTRTTCAPWSRRRASASRSIPKGGDVVELAEQGFYELRGQANGAGPAATVAANVDLAESDLTPMDPREIVAAVGGSGNGTPGSGTAEMSDATREATQRMWWYLLFAAALFLGGGNGVGE